MYASSSRASSLADAVHQRVRVARRELRLRDLDRREARAPSRPRARPAPGRRAARLEIATPARTRSARRRATASRSRSPSPAPWRRRRPAAGRRRGPRRPARCAGRAPAPSRAPRPLAATSVSGVDDRDAHLLDDPLAQILVADRQLHLRLGIRELRLDVEREGHPPRRRPASCSRCRTARRGGAARRPRGCAGSPASRTMRPLPDVLDRQVHRQPLALLDAAVAVAAAVVDDLVRVREDRPLERLDRRRGSRRRPGRARAPRRSATSRRRRA